MLVLSRNLRQKIVILVGDEVITVMVCHVRGERVKLGLTGSPEVRFWRDELYQDILQRGGDGKRGCPSVTDAKG